MAGEIAKKRATAEGTATTDLMARVCGCRFYKQAKGGNCCYCLGLHKSRILFELSHSLLRRHLASNAAHACCLHHSAPA